MTQYFFRLLISINDSLHIVHFNYIYISWLSTILAEDMLNNEQEPEPDYHDDAEPVDVPAALQKSERSPSVTSDDGFIQPKKIPNPCVESPSRMALHKELLLNYKR